jgi:S1-C subfamily serine protease
LIGMRKKVGLIASVIVILLLLGFGSGILGFRSSKLSFSLPSWTQGLRISGPATGPQLFGNSGNVQVVTEESVTIDVVKKVTPAVVTVGITTTQPVIDWGMGSDPFGFGFGFPQPQQQGTQQVKQDIGSGFIIQNDGLVITNKHVVSDTSAKYRIITADNKSFDVQKIYRDPNNDLAILKINATNLPTVELGDSGKL